MGYENNWGELQNVLKNNNWGLEQMEGWKILHMHTTKNNLGRLANHILSINRKVNEIIVVP